MTRKKVLSVPSKASKIDKNLSHDKKCKRAVCFFGEGLVIWLKFQLRFEAGDFPTFEKQTALNIESKFYEVKSPAPGVTTQFYLLLVESPL